MLVYFSSQKAHHTSDDSPHFTQAKAAPNKLFDFLWGPRGPEPWLSLSGACATQPLRYYKRVKSLPATWKYVSTTASALVAPHSALEKLQTWEGLDALGRDRRLGVQE